METSGTLAYMAPEQHLGGFDASTDLYALGATLYEMLAEEPPFQGPDFLAQKRRMFRKALGRLSFDASRRIRKRDILPQRS